MINNQARSFWFAVICLMGLSNFGCMGNQALLGSFSGGESGLVDSEGEISENTQVPEHPEDPGNDFESPAQADPFPVPFEEPPSDGGTSTITRSDEPSVFSSQVGEGNNPRPRQILCDISISLDLVHSGNEHDVACPTPEDSAVTDPPYAVVTRLMSSFSKTFEASCRQKNPHQAFWSFDIYIDEFIFTGIEFEPVKTKLEHLELELFYLRNGLWESVAVYPLEVDCKEWHLGPAAVGSPASGDNSDVPLSSF